MLSLVMRSCEAKPDRFKRGLRGLETLIADASWGGTEKTTSWHRSQNASGSFCRPQGPGGVFLGCIPDIATDNYIEQLMDVKEYYILV